MKEIDIPKEKLIELYVDKKMTQFEIAEIYNVDRTTISNKLKKFQIDSDPRQRKYILLKEVPLTKIQREMIVGSLLGDASVVLGGRRKVPYFKVGHSEKQRDYVFWKKEIMGNFVNNVRKYKDKRGNSIMYNFHTISHKELHFFRKLFYDNNKKIIKDEISLYLTPLGLAVWFMDDGSKQNKCNYRLATDGFSEEENYRLKDILKANFDINAKVCGYTRRNNSYFYLNINKRNSINMTYIIKDYIIDCMKYKLIDGSYLTKPIDCSPTIKRQTPQLSSPKNWREEWQALKKKLGR